jgi:thiol-disulfide isomerase/thioredoxin
MLRFVASVVVLVGSLVIQSIATAQGSGSGSGESGFQLPTDPTMWVNSGPISSDALKGKAAFLYFYEEGCPRCRARWPELVELSKKYADKPIVFIAVNSGNPRPAVEQYLRGVRVAWPTIVDPAREFEKAADVGEISLQNIYQAKIITADGTLAGANAGDPEGSIERALAGAKWHVPPDEVPAQLKQAWLNVEFNQFAAAGPTIKKALALNKAEIKEAATKLNDAVQTRIEADVAAAEEAATSGDKWAAYKAYQKVNTTYTGFTLPEAVASSLKELGADETVAKEVAAAKALEAAKRLLNSPSTRRSASVRLKKLVMDHAGTEAATEAENLLSALGSN